jgi:hypothetical protein
VSFSPLQWEDGMSPVERAVNRSLLLKMKHYERHRAASAPARVDRVSSHGALQVRVFDLLFGANFRHPACTDIEPLRSCLSLSMCLLQPEKWLNTFTLKHAG